MATEINPAVDVVALMDEMRSTAEHEPDLGFDLHPNELAALLEYIDELESEGTNGDYPG